MQKVQSGTSILTASSGGVLEASTDFASCHRFGKEADEQAVSTEVASWQERMNASHSYLRHAVRGRIALCIQRMSQTVHVSVVANSRLLITSYMPCDTDL